MATYSAPQLPNPMASNNKCPMPGKVRSIADSGAQMDILALREFEAMRVLPSSLSVLRYLEHFMAPVSTSLEPPSQCSGLTCPRK